MATSEVTNNPASTGNGLRPPPSPNHSTHSIQSASDDGHYFPKPSANGSYNNSIHDSVNGSASVLTNGTKQDSNPTESAAPSPPAAAAAIAGPPKKPGLSTRLTRMFSHRADTYRGESPAPSTENGRPRATSGANRLDSITGEIPVRERPSAAHRDSSARGFRTTRNGSNTDRTASPGTDKIREGSIVKKDVANSVHDANGNPSRRFVLLEDGSHEHNLKPERRQEKLSDLFGKMLGKKKDGTAEDHPLSMMSSWVDQLRNEKAAPDQKGGPNFAISLVEKYGECHEVIGRGAFGIVRISHKTDEKDPKKEQLYAVKEFRRRPSESQKRYNKRLTSEFCISSALRHPNVIHTLDLMKDAKGDFCEVMEFCAGGDLYTLVLAAGKLEVLEADCYFKQLMRGVEYIHEMGVAHRDLKPENLLLTLHGALKITDFGNGECFRMAWEKEPHMVAGLCGSAPYIAPEEYVDQEFDPRAVDVWACGVIYMAMRTGRHLWRVARKDEDEFYERYLEGRRDENGYGPIETLHRARCRNVIYSVLDPNATRRITASQVLKSEWGREIKICKAGEEGF